jgi:hypothetical protein
MVLWFVRRFLNDLTLSLQFSDYLPFKRTWPLICKILNSLYLRMICTIEVWLKLAFWFPIKRVLETFSEFLLFCSYHLLLGKRVVLHLYNSEFPMPKDDLYQVWLKLAQQFWRSRKCKCLTDRQDRQMDNRQSLKLTWDFSSGELKNKNWGGGGTRTMLLTSHFCISIVLKMNSLCKQKLLTN